jgi:hypothetical protein
MVFISGRQDWTAIYLRDIDFAHAQAKAGGSFYAAWKIFSRSSVIFGLFARRLAHISFRAGLPSEWIWNPDGGLDGKRADSGAAS